MSDQTAGNFLNNRIGTPVRRKDAWEKASGRAQYIGDISLPGMLYGKLIRSEVAHGRILGITLPEMSAESECYFISRKDIPEGGVNRLQMITDDWRVFAEEEVRYIGETIGILAAPDRELLLKLASEIKIEYEQLDAAFTIDEGLSCKGGALFGDDNLYADYRLKKGDPDTIFSKEGSYRIITDELETSFQEHAYMETQGMICALEDGKFVFTASCQCPYYMRKAVAGVVGAAIENVIVKQAVTGGAFGGKEHFPDVIAGPLITAVNVIGKPIQIIFDRREDISFTAKRHPSRIRFKTAVDAEDRIVGMDVDIVINGGGYQSASNIVLQRAMFSVNSVYDLPNVRIHGRAVATNTFPSDAFRGFGAPQGIFACELHMAHLAKILGVDEVSFKQRFFTKKGGLTVTNGVIHEEVKLPEIAEKVLSQSQYSEKLENFSRVKELRGIGVSFYNHGGGFTGDGEKEIIKAKVRVEKDAADGVSILVSNVEMGQGFATTCSKVAAKVLGIPFDSVTYHQPDTSVVPDSGPTVASRSMMVVGRLVEVASRRLLEKWESGKLQSAEADYEQPEWLKWDGVGFQGDAYPAFGWGACVVEVEVDPLTSEIETKGIWTAHDIGVPIDDLIAHGQVHGGVIQSLGYGSLEKLEISGGAFRQNTFADYMIPTSMDFPSVESCFVENPFDFGPFGAKGMGELVFDGAASAYALAVQNAIGAHICAIPVTPEAVQLLRKGESV